LGNFVAINVRLSKLNPVYNKKVAIRDMSKFTVEKFAESLSESASS